MLCVHVKCEHRHNITATEPGCLNVVHKYLSIFIDVCSYEFQSCHCIIFFTRHVIIKEIPCLDPFLSLVGEVFYCYLSGYRTTGGGGAPMLAINTLIKKYQLFTV